MSGEAEDLMLSLMQIADDREEAPAASEIKPTVLSALKPYPTHQGCGGIVSATLGRNEDEDLVVCFKCLKCGFTDYVDVKGMSTDGNSVVADTNAPPWVTPPTL